jgi:type VI secretion system protein ImpM
MPQEPAFFFFRSPNARNALVGVFSPSRDSVGRQYPMVIFALLDLPGIAPRFPVVPVMYASFLASACNIIGQGPQLTAARLGDLVRALVPPTAADYPAADVVCRRTLDTTPAAEIQRRLFGEPSSGKQYYAFRTFLNACDPVRAKEPTKTNVTLDCPIGGDTDLFAWLDVARRVLRWSSASPPSFFWTEGLQPRLILPLGPPPPPTLLYLARPDHGGAKLWPLVTERPDAIEAARQQLSQPHRRAIDEPATSLELLLATLAG